jgi:hypothetical protein
MIKAPTFATRSKKSDGEKESADSSSNILVLKRRKNFEKITEKFG